MCDFNCVKICRACLTTEDCKFYELRGNIRYFQDFLKIELDRLSMHWLCHNCNHRITKMLEFTDKVLKIDALFQRMLNKNRIKKNIDINRLLVLKHNIGFPTLSKKTVLNDELCVLYWDEKLEPEIPIIKTEIISLDKIENLSDLQPDANDNFEEDSLQNVSDIFEVIPEQGSSGKETVIDRASCVSNGLDSGVCFQSMERSHDTDFDNDILKLADESPVDKLNPKLKPKVCVQINLNEEEQLEMFRKQAYRKRYIEAVYQCKLCYMGFVFKDTYQVHMEKHSKFAGQYECDICHIFTETKTKMQIHKRHHARMYRCIACDYTGFDRKTVLIHCRVKHGKDEYGDPIRPTRSRSNNTKVECHDCGRRYATRDTLSMHIRRKHINTINEAARPHKCEECGKCFRFRVDVRFHSVVHSNKRDFYCVECDKSFKTPYALAHHLKTAKRHVDVENYKQCHQCPSKFVSNPELNRHIKSVHEHLERVKCDYCSKSYAHKRELNKHIKMIHTDGEPQRTNKCDICGKLFLHKKYLAIHKNVHTGNRPHKCTLCDATFIYPASLFTHNQLVHLKIKRKWDLKKLKNKTDKTNTDLENI